VNVDTGQFQALTERVEALGQSLRAMAEAELILRRAGMDDGMRRGAGYRPERQARHLRAVK
jgi:hypothetical protein